MNTDLVLEQLRLIRADLAELKTEMDDKLSEMTHQLTQVELGIVAFRRAAELVHTSLTGLILDGARVVVDQSLLDQRLCVVSGEQYLALLDSLDRPAQDNPGLRDLFSRPAPWEAK